MSGGQWPQARRAAVRGWTADTRCQLCFTATGTLAHRDVCPAIRPPQGWIVDAPFFDNVAAGLTPSRRHALLTKGLLLMRVRAPPRHDHPRVRWLTAEPNCARGDLRWYVDGSVVDQDFPELVTAAAAIVVTSIDGDLLAYAEVALPPSVRSSGAAEAWALYLAIVHGLSRQAIITDCRSLLDAASGGITRATAASRPLAALWRRIGAAVDEPVQQLVKGEWLVWMPSHVARARLGVVLRSDGQPVTELDWRANRLVDALARRRAFAEAAPRADVHRLELAARAAAAAAAALGACTFAANHHPVTCTSASGATIRVVRRDAVDATHRTAGTAKRPWRKRVPRPPKPLKPLAERTVAPAAAVHPRSEASRAATAQARASSAARAATRDFLVRQTLAERHAGAAPVVADSYERRAALLERVRLRQTAAVTVLGVSGSGAVSPCES